jgi:hypothetical protein
MAGAVQATGRIGGEGLPNTPLQLVGWFATCWVNAHDDLKFYDLKLQRWCDE